MQKISHDINRNEAFAKNFMDKFPSLYFKMLKPQRINEDRKIATFNVLVTLLQQCFNVPEGFKEREYTQRETLDHIFKYGTLVRNVTKEVAPMLSKKSAQLKPFLEHWHMIIFSAFRSRNRKLRTVTAGLAPLVMVVDPSFAEMLLAEHFYGKTSTSSLLQHSYASLLEGSSQQEKMFLTVLRKYAKFCPNRFVASLRKYLRQQNTRRFALRTLLKMTSIESRSSGVLTRTLRIILYENLASVMLKCLPLQNSGEDSVSTSNRTESGDSSVGDTDTQPNLEDPQGVGRTFSSASVGSGGSATVSHNKSTHNSGEDDIVHSKTGLHVPIECEDWESFCLLLWIIILMLPSCLPLIQSRLASSLDLLCRILQAYFPVKQAAVRNDMKTSGSDNDTTAHDLCNFMCMDDAVQTLVSVFCRLFPQHSLHALRKCREVVASKAANKDGTSEATRNAKVEFIMFISGFIKSTASDILTATMFTSESETDSSRWYALLPDTQTKVFRQEINASLFGEESCDTATNPESVFIYLIGQCWERAVSSRETCRPRNHLHQADASAQCDIVCANGMDNLEHDNRQNAAQYPMSASGHKVGNLQFAMSPDFNNHGDQGGNVSDLSLSSQSAISGSNIAGQSYHTSSGGAMIREESKNSRSLLYEHKDVNTVEVQGGSYTCERKISENTSAKQSYSEGCATESIQEVSRSLVEHEKWSALLLRKFHQFQDTSSAVLNSINNFSQGMESSSRQVSSATASKFSAMFPGHSSDISPAAKLYRVPLGGSVPTAFPKDMSWQQSQVMFERHLRELEAKKCRHLQAKVAQIEANAKEDSSLQSLFTKQQSTISLLRKEIDRLQSRLKEIDAANGQRLASLKHQLGKLNDERHRLSEEVMAKTQESNEQNARANLLESELHNCQSLTKNSDSRRLQEVQKQRDDALQEAKEAKEQTRRWQEFYLTYIEPNLSNADLRQSHEGQSNRR